MIFKFKAGDPQWLELRCKYITATESASLFGLNSYMSANQVYQQKHTKDKLANRFLRDGKILESAVLQAIREDHGWWVEGLGGTDGNTVYTLNHAPISATPDAFRWDDPSIVECKTTSLESFDKNWRTGNPPLRYVAQVQVQMMVTGMLKGFLCCIAATPDIPLAVYQIDYCPMFTSRLVELVEEYGLIHANGGTIRVRSEDKRLGLECLSRSVNLVSLTRFTEDEE